MKINKKYHITKKHSREIVTNLFGRGRKKVFYSGDSEYNDLDRIVSITRKYSRSDEWKNRNLRLVFDRTGWFNPSEIDARLIEIPTVFNETPEVEVCETSAPHIPTIGEIKEMKANACNKLVDFFSEFNFSPSFRFTNTLAMVAKPVEYVHNYFAIQDHQYVSEISEKIKSMEFKDILKTLRDGVPSKKINSRMKIYYGAPGTGKTTKAEMEADAMIVCTSDMLPKDLMQVFNFEDGKATFKRSRLWEAMENGEVIVLDEINMLPFETLRFLQGFTDGKTEFNFNGETVHIKDGFSIIGTMNLNVGGAVLSIPEPLVDRCYDIVEFTLNGSALVDALM